MRSWIAAVSSRRQGPRVLWFLLLELACIGGFLLSVIYGRSVIAAISLFGPVQFLIWAALASQDHLVLLFVALMTPLAMADFVPHAYHRFVLYPGTIALLVAFRLTQPVSEGQESCPGLGSAERIPARMLVAWSLIVFLLAVQRGLWSMWMFNFNVFALEILLLSYFFATVPRSLRDIRGLVHALGGMSVLVVILFQFLADRGGHGDWLMGGKALSTPYGLLDMNAFGAVAGSTAVALVGVASGQKDQRVRAVQLTAALVLVMFLAVTKSRGAWLGFGVALLYVLARARSAWLTGMIAGGGGLLLASGLLRRVLTVRLEATTAYDPSLLGRLLLWRTAWEGFKNNWLFGVGWENFRMVKVHYGFPNIPDQMKYNAHNMYMEVLVDLGIVGLCLFLWLLVGILARTDKVARSRQAEGWSVALAMNAAIIAFSVHGFLDCLTNAFVASGDGQPGRHSDPSCGAGHRRLTL
jgi:O-antigen ligase